MSRSRTWRDGSIGFGAAVLPLALPVAALTLPRASWRFRRDDLPWLLSAALFLSLSAIHRTFDWNVVGVVLAWLVQHVGRRVGADPVASRAAGIGLGAGIMVLVLWSTVQVAVIGAPRASGPWWFHHPNVFAHAWIVFAVLATALPSQRWMPLPALLPLAGVALAMTGSRSGVLAALVAVALLVPWARWPRRRLVALLAAVVGVVAIVLVAVPRPPWLERIVGSWAPSTGGTASINLLMASEDLDEAGVWAPLHVSVTGIGGPGVVPAEWRVVRTAAAAWSRPQQSVVLEAGRRYTLTGEFRSLGTGSRPGLLGWGQDDTGTHQLTVGWDEGGPHGAVLGRLANLEVAATPLAAGWTRLSASFDVTGEQPVRIGLGPNPDLATATPGTTVDTRALQLEVGAVASPYEPSRVPRASAADLARGEAMARIPLWRSAWSAIRERPFAGWGYAAFGGYLELREPSLAAAPHAHNQLLATLFEGGIIGVVAGVALLAGLYHRRSRSMRAVLVALLVANLFDATLLITVVLVPAAFLSGVSAARSEPAPPVRPLRT